MNHDIEKIRTELTDLAVELSKGIEGPRLSLYLQWIGKERYSSDGWHETAEFIELCESAKRMALKKVWGRTRDLKAVVEDYLDFAQHDVSVFEISRDLNITTKEEKGRLRTILCRLCDDKIIENTGRGLYHKVKESKFVDWISTVSEPVKLWLPFELSSPDFSVLTHGDIVLFMGSPNTGKTAVSMAIAKENRHKYNVYYFSTEISAEQFRRRMSKFADCSIEQMSEINFATEFGSFADAIVPGRGNLNIIDYIEVYDNFWEIGTILAKIHSKLDGAMAICNVQKDPKKEYGIGGNFSQWKPMLTVALDPGNIATIRKLKEWACKDNPNYKVFNYKLIDGCRFTRKIPSIGWVSREKGGYEHGI